ncbi:hypothetical protein LCGC14_1866720 [marine sediment metagenome]|uniref:Right handed beta helix domain-containing protein n=1 Tax=marine sediment metagenome TaxID=412755 RepID=A0A0F9G634_9ZZZZ
MSFGILTSKYRRQGSGRPTLIDGLPVVQQKGKHWYVDGTRGASGGGTSYDAAFLLPSEAVAKASAYDFVHVAPNNGSPYVESAVLDVSVRGLTFIGEGPIASVWVQPTTAGQSGVRVTADEVTFQNFGGESNATGLYGLDVADAVEEFRAYYSKFGGGGGGKSAVKFTGPGPLLLEHCEIAWAGYGIELIGGVTSWPTQIRVNKCLFHNLSISHVFRSTIVGTIVKNYVHTNNVHDLMEDGSGPSDSFIRIDNANSTGMIVGNRFATATNATLKFRLNADELIKWGPNATEAGWSSARPS